MRTVVITYKDRVGCAEGIYETKPYDPVKAKDVAEQLKLMGCFDVKLVPSKESA